MTALTDSNTTDSFDNTTVVIKGGTDNTSIGNVGDRLKVDAVVTGVSQASTFSVFTGDISIGNNKSMVSLQNASGSSVTLKIYKIYLVNTQTNSVTGIVSEFNVLRATSHSGGTLLTSLPYDTGDSISSSLTVRTGASISGEASSPIMTYKYSSDDWGVGSNDVESADHMTNQAIPIYSHIVGTKPLTVRSNQTLHIKHTVNSTNGTFAITVLFTQE